MGKHKIIFTQEDYFIENELLDQTHPSGKAGFEYKSVYILAPKLLNKLYCTLVMG